MTSPLVLTATGLNSLLLPSDFPNVNNIANVIAAGGGGQSGAVKASNSVGGTGNGGGAGGGFSLKNNFNLAAGSTVYYFVGTGGVINSTASGGDSWFND